MGAHFCWISGFRNSAAETVEQELLFVGSETGKLTAMRELVKKVFWRGGGSSAGDLSCVFCQRLVVSQGTEFSVTHVKPLSKSAAQEKTECLPILYYTSGSRLGVV